MPIYKDKSRNTYYVRVRVEQNDGTKKHVRRRGFKTKKAAKEMEAKLLAGKEETNSITFRQLAEQYLKWYEKRRKLSSFKKKKNIIRNHLIPEFKDRFAVDIVANNVMEYQDKIIGNYSNDYLKSIHVTLSAIFTFGIRYKGLKTNPASVAGNFELEDNKRLNYWTFEEFKKFIEVVDDLTFSAFFYTKYYSGARKGELLALTWKDIDFKDNKISITETEYDREVTKPKSKSSERNLVMPDFVMEALKELKKDAGKTAPVKSDYVVFGEFYTSIATTTLDRHYEKYIKASGVKRIVLHEFRHSHASYLIDKNVNPIVIAHRLGHSDVATTLNTYSHMYPSKQKEAVELMENDFS
ncbi:tyrosine-type recombinase/integrase [Natribacillus halophilus]|uniref:Site-specific recombinase XerD n=1 Tax=Natribacillus halophilus TaxID=549003 RepID=A0A1G8KKB5_9BACI|nr:tyrosine-type recombinase/integrase [Natribacillus halophilus]SDI43844.1 Site-specific recombinase XerD [Natribacillus halophilus]